MNFKVPDVWTDQTQRYSNIHCIYKIYLTKYIHIYIIILYIGGLFKINQNYGSPKLPLRRAFATLSRPIRIGTRNYDHAFLCIFRINSGIQTFCETFAAFSRPFATAAKTRVHICRCHLDTKSLAWVFERFPYIIQYYTIYLQEC